uniref:Elongation factor 4 n=1 Tax=Zeugodacus cucurbitae TaxID=28588 RepID=A0A0A1WG33_ZEUCU
MDYEVNASLRVVFQAIEERCSRPVLFDRFELQMLLESLKPLEQLLVARYFCKLPWNIGSLRVLAILQSSNILTASNYILSLENDEEIQLILNDFLEAEFELLKELYTVAYYDSSNAISLNDALDECLSRLYTDLIQNPKINDLTYINGITKNMPPDFILNLMQRHIRIALDLHKSNAKKAFGNFSNWINEGVDEIQFTKELYEKLLKHSEQEAISYLFKLSSLEHFNQWKFYLILLQTLTSKCSDENGAFIRKYLKTRLTQISALPKREYMLHLLLSVRAATATTMDIDKNITAYADWYKRNVADMKFVLKVEEFKAIIDLLEQCIPYESLEDYLEIHATFSISPPIHCGKLVQSYKSKCKMQLAKIKSKVKQGNEHEESIVIDD